MEQKITNKYFPNVGDGSGLAQTDGLYTEELQLALRNHGMPLEALRYPITPTGLHYLLIHYDIPEVNAEQWRLKITGLVGKPLELTLDEIKKRPRLTMPVAMECAGNGRALFAPRRISQPWLLEAIGNSEWTGTPLRGILQDAGLSSAAVEIVFTGLDQGVEGEQIQFYQRSLTVERLRSKPPAREVIRIKVLAGPTILVSDLKAPTPRDGFVFYDANALCVHMNDNQLVELS